MIGKICFVSLNSYPLFTKSMEGNYGGAEIQTFLLAKRLTDYNLNIAFIIYSNSKIDKDENIKKINLIKTYNSNKNISLLLKLFYLWQAMNEANADFYYHRAGGAPGIIAFFTRIKKKKFILHIASDANIDESKKLKNITFFAKIGLKLDILLADIIVVQNSVQEKSIKDNYGRNSTIIRNCFDICERKSTNHRKQIIVLWVGSISEVKQPIIFLNLARLFPKIKFRMVGGVRDDKNYYENIKNLANEVSNLEFMGQIPFDKMNDIFSEASIFINTSRVEGFPNTFIQAWMNCVPVLSLCVDPDEIICTHRLGYHSNSFERMSNDLKLLIDDDKLRAELGENGRMYVENNHDIKKLAEKYLKLFIIHK